MSATHAKRFDAAIVSQHLCAKRDKAQRLEIAATWHVIDCKCGWCSPLRGSPKEEARVNSFTVRGDSTGETATRGASGVPLGRVV